jgi:hypothetical protein
MSNVLAMSENTLKLIACSDAEGEPRMHRFSGIDEQLL